MASNDKVSQRVFHFARDHSRFTSNCGRTESNRRAPLDRQLTSSEYQSSSLRLRRK